MQPQTPRRTAQTFTPTATKGGDKLDGSLKAEYSIAKGMKTEVTLATSGVLKCVFEASDAIMKGMTCSMEGETVAPGKSGMLSSGLTSVDYKSGPLRCKGSYDFYKGDLVGAPRPTHPSGSPERRRRRGAAL